MAVLVIAEHDNVQLKSSIRNTVGAALRLDDEIHVLVVGSACVTVAETAAQVTGVTKILLADTAAYVHSLAEDISPLIAKLGRHYSHIVGAASTYTRAVLPRAAALIPSAMVSEVIDIKSPTTFCRPIHTGHAIATVTLDEHVKVLTIRPTHFGAVSQEGGSAVIESIDTTDQRRGLSDYLRREGSTSMTHTDVTTARIVIVGGRGVGSREGFALIETLGHTLGAAVGATSPVVEAGWTSFDCQIGHTGKTIAPDLYLGIGVSGADYHVSGIKESKVIVAINKDAKAPIFHVADYGYVADLFEAVPQLIAMLTVE